MTEEKDSPAPEVAPLRRVLAWWDVDMHIGAFRKRKVTAHPLRELERVLGHRLHVEGWDRFHLMPEGVWKFHAYNYLETPDPAVAAYTMLTQLKKVSTSLSLSGYNFNSQATTQIDEHNLCAFYWKPPEQLGLPRYVSSGVLLMLVDAAAETFIDPDDPHARRRRLARPVVVPPKPPEERADYVIEFKVHIICGNKQDLLSYHWPRFLAAHWPEGIDHVEIDSRIHAGKPNVLRVSKTLRNVREHKAVAYCLERAPYFRVSLGSDPSFEFKGARDSAGEGIVAFRMTRGSK